MSSPIANRPLVNRQVNQAERISAGVADGSLTKGEAVRLSVNQLRVDARIAHAKTDDGVVGPGERVGIRAAQARNSADIFVQRHDKQVQGG
jgi:hypothetical protein